MVRHGGSRPWSAVAVSAARPPLYWRAINSSKPLLREEDRSDGRSLSTSRRAGRGARPRSAVSARGRWGRLGQGQGGPGQPGGGAGAGGVGEAPRPGGG